MSECTLVTGGSGFIGAHLMKAIVSRNEEVINYDISQPSHELQKLLADSTVGITHINGNILDLPTLISVIKDRNVKKIVHLAALFHPLESIQRPYITNQINYVGTMNVLEAARILDLERVICISTIGVYPEKHYEPMDENHPILIPGIGHPHHYGASKAAAEILGLTYWRCNKVKFVALRFSGVFGFGMIYSMFIKDMIEDALQKKPTKFETGGKLYRDYTYVKDCVNAVILALNCDEDKLKRRIYLTTSGNLHSGSEVAKIVSELIPDANIEIGEALTEYERNDLAKRGKLDISTAKEDLGYAPRYTLEDSIIDYIKEYRKYRV